jgi:hypothetical protein
MIDQLTESGEAIVQEGDFHGRRFASHLLHHLPKTLAYEKTDFIIHDSCHDARFACGSTTDSE